MKNTFKSIIKTITLCLIMVTAYSCADDELSNEDLNFENEDIIEDEPDKIEDDTQEDGGEEITEFSTTNLTQLISLYEDEVIAFADTPLLAYELMTSGFVISSDYDKNINHQIYIQDQAENATSGLVIDVAVDDIYRTLSIGQEIQVKLDGLGMQKIDNTYHIGLYNETDQSISPISKESFETFIIATDNVQDIIPKLLTIKQIQEETIPTILVAIEKVQLNEVQLGATFADEGNSNTEDSKVNKTLMNCEDSLTIELQNNTNSKFNFRPFPKGQGTITAILSSNALIIRDVYDIVFEETRCTIQEDVLNDGELLSEDFQNISKINDIIAMTGWENINISNPELLLFWKAKISDSNIYAEIEQGGSSSTYDAWLITETIEIGDIRTLKVALDINVNKHNSNSLKIFIINEVTGETIDFDEENNEIEGLVPLNETEGFTTTETIITIPEELEHFRIGFRYQKGSTAATTEYQIDNIEITETE
ncbi:hypothetical protein F6U93_12840 [Tamlana haliotis]|uniref:DUF5689 domain-containing protein n=1 Tax=Pseudotamlana haliotis TaxID=2614804 RepID=A0A6N6MAP7_9FLAO|nr:DUF5689 domain-containing protein [Tamlana haliotis]KAB1067293.1 hypothetical protein F6U93_12840 [Tamlana haliotis]